MNKMKSKRRMEQVLCYVVLILLALMVLVPVLWMISTAFKTEAQTYSPKPQWIPDPISLESFRKFFTTYNFGRMTLNSLVTCIFAMIICITCACLAGYGVTRFQFKDKKQAKQVLSDLFKDGTLVKLNPGAYLYKDHYEKAMELLRGHFASHDTMSLAEFRDMLGTSRKYVLLILDHLDQQKITKLQGDVRVLLK